MSAKRVSILVAGDLADELGKLTSRLQMEGYRVFPVANRDAIMTLARSEVPNLILLDLNPCFDVCRFLKRSFVTESIPVIALIDQATEKDRIVALELGVDDCQGKPFNFRELLLRIRCSLNRAEERKGKVRYVQAQYYSALTQPSSGTAPEEGTP